MPAAFSLTSKRRSSRSEAGISGVTDDLALQVAARRARSYKLQRDALAVILLVLGLVWLILRMS